MAARRHSVLSRRQWLGGGLSARQLDRALAGRAVHVLHPGVYALRGAKPSFERDVVAACLATGGVASHRCAAYLWKFRRFERPVVEVVVSKGHAPSLRGVTVRRTGPLVAPDMTRVGAIPVTSRARSLLDLVAVAPERVEGALDGALHTRRLSVRTMECLLERASPELLFGIEAQGVVAHSAREDVQRNAEKANDLVEWWILYFTHGDVHGTPGHLAGRIEETMARRRTMLRIRPAA